MVEEIYILIDKLNPQKVTEKRKNSEKFSSIREKMAYLAPLNLSYAWLLSS